MRTTTNRPFLTTISAGQKESPAIVVINENKDGVLVADVYPTDMDKGLIYFGDITYPKEVQDNLSLTLPKPTIQNYPAGRTKELSIAGRAVFSPVLANGIERIILFSEDIILTDDDNTTQSILLWYPEPLEAGWERTINPQITITWKNFQATILQRPIYSLTFNPDEGTYIHIQTTGDHHMNFQAVKEAIDDLDHCLTFMSSKANQAKIAIAFDSAEFHYASNPTWTKWLQQPNTSQRQEPSWIGWNHSISFNTTAQEILNHLTPDLKEAVDRYTEAFDAYERGNWRNAVTQSVAILNHLHGKKDNHQNITKFLIDNQVQRHKTIPAWNKERPKEIGPTIELINTLRNNATAHWDRNVQHSEDYLWITEQSIFYTEATLARLLSPNTAIADRGTGLHY